METIIINSAKKLIEIIDSMHSKALVIFPLNEDGKVIVMESGDINPETIEIGIKKELIALNQLLRRGRESYATFFKNIEKIKGAAIKDGAKIYETTCKMWYEAAGWLEEWHIKEMSARFMEEIKYGTVFMYGCGGV